MGLWWVAQSICKWDIISDLEWCTPMWIFFFFCKKIWNASRICVSSLRRGHANLLCIIPIFSICAAEASTPMWILKMSMAHLRSSDPQTLLYFAYEDLIKYRDWIAQLVKNLPAMQETPVRFLGQEDLLEKGWATHFSILGLPLCLSW